MEILILALRQKPKKKIKQIKKNRREKDMRALYFGVNPHSKGLIFSRSYLIFLLTLMPIIITIKIILKTLKSKNKK